MSFAKVKTIVLKDYAKLLDPQKKIFNKDTMRLSIYQKPRVYYLVKVCYIIWLRFTILFFIPIKALI